MGNLETLEQLLDGLKTFSENTVRATHSLYYSKDKKKWVVNLTNKRKVFYGESPIEAVEAAYVYIKYERNLNKKGVYSL